MIMFGNTKAYSGFSVKDLQETKKFYQDILGLKVEEKKEMPVLTLYLAGDVRILAYEKPDHTPATFTILNFEVKHIEEAVDQLTAKGITFEKYEGAIKTDEKGIFRGGGPLIAWFADPSGNILSVIQS